MPRANVIRLYFTLLEFLKFSERRGVRQKARTHSAPHRQFAFLPPGSKRHRQTGSSLTKQLTLTSQPASQPTMKKSDHETHETGNYLECHPPFPLPSIALKLQTAKLLGRKSGVPLQIPKRGDGRTPPYIFMYIDMWRRSKNQGKRRKGSERKERTNLPANEHDMPWNRNCNRAKRLRPDPDCQGQGPAGKAVGWLAGLTGWL
jgi:hypothetical protein